MHFDTCILAEAEPAHLFQHANAVVAVSAETHIEPSILFGQIWNAISQKS